MLPGLLEGVCARVVAETGGLVHVNPGAVDVEASLWAVEHLEFVSPVAAKISEYTTRVILVGVHSLLSLWVEPVREDGHAGPYSTKERAAVVGRLEPHVSRGTAVEGTIALSRRIRDGRISHQHCNGRSEKCHPIQAEIGRAHV